MCRILQSLQKCQRKVQRAGLVADATPDLAWMGHRLVAIEGKNVEIKPGDWRVFHSWKFEPGFWCLTCVWLNELNLFKFYWLNWSFFWRSFFKRFHLAAASHFLLGFRKKRFGFSRFFLESRVCVFLFLHRPTAGYFDGLFDELGYSSEPDQKR